MLATLEAHQMSLLGGALPFASTSGSSNGRAKEVKEAKSVWEMDDADFDDEEDSEDDEDDEEEGEDEGDERAQSGSSVLWLRRFLEADFSLPSSFQGRDSGCIRRTWSRIV